MRRKSFTGMPVRVFYPAWRLLLPLLLLLPGCILRDQLLFDDPEPKIELYSELGRASSGGGTLFYGEAINNGSLTAEDVTIMITVFGGGGANLGTYSGPVATGYTDEEGVLNTLEPDAVGSFRVLAPVPLGQIASQEIKFTFNVPIEE